jgi:hypothetical protein
MYPVFGETYYLIVKIYAVGSRFFYIVVSSLPDKNDIKSQKIVMSMVTAVIT